MNRPPRPKEQGKTENYIERKCRELMEAKAENAELKELLKAADCPNCDGSGSIPVQVASYQLAEPDWEQQQCQWCDEREQALKG